MADQHSVAAVTNALGHQIFVNPADQRGKALIASNANLNPDSLAVWELAVADGHWDLVLDVGSNYGEMIATVDLSRAKRIVAFEPNPLVLDYLRRTIRGLPWSVELGEVAISSFESQAATLTLDLDWSGTTTLTNQSEIALAGHESRTREVAVTTIDAFLGEQVPKRICMKVDVEGAELDVLMGARETFSRVDEAIVMIEILHLSVENIARLAREHPMFVLDTVDRRLVRIFGKDRVKLGQQLYSGRIYRQDAILLAGQNASTLERKIRLENPEPETAREVEIPQRAVYTALLGGYETLQEQPAALESTIPFICLTDDPSLTSETWDVRLVEPLFPLDPVRSARALKIIGHELLAEYNQTIWVDNRVILKETPEKLFDAVLAEADFGAIRHSFRDALIDEFDAVADGGYDDPSRIYEQLIHYAETTPDLLNAKPVWTGLLVRRVNDTTASAMRTWLDHVLRYSRRDQLSLLVALRSNDVKVKLLDYDNRESPWHVWPPLAANLGRQKLRTHRFEQSIRAPLARLRESTTRSDEVIAAYQQSADLRDAEIRRLEAVAKGLHQETVSLTRRLESTDRKLRDAARELRAVRATRSYRLVRRFGWVRAAARLLNR